jgi:hypothetical protein
LQKATANAGADSFSSGRGAVEGTNLLVGGRIHLPAVQSRPPVCRGIKAKTALQNGGEPPKVLFVNVSGSATLQLMFSVASSLSPRGKPSVAGGMRVAGSVSPGAGYAIVQ